MTPEQIAELEALAAKATPGPWEACEPGDYGDFDGDSRVMCGDDKRLAVFHWNERYTDGNDADIELSVALRNNLPAILAALKAQQPDEAMVERVATVLAPFVCRPVFSGDCDDIAAGQSHARYVARAAIAAMQENRDD